MTKVILRELDINPQSKWWNRSTVINFITSTLSTKDSKALAKMCYSLQVDDIPEIEQVMTMLLSKKTFNKDEELALIKIAQSQPHRVRTAIQKAGLELDQLPQRLSEILLDHLSTPKISRYLCF